MKEISPLRLPIVAITCLVSGYLIAEVMNRVLRHKQHHGVEELKLAVLNLKHSDHDVSPQLREYLKGRVYTLVANGIKDDWVNGQVDYGRIDRNVLGDVSLAKGGYSDDELYETAMKISGKNPSPRLQKKNTEATENTSGGKPPVFIQDIVAIRIPKIAATDTTLGELISFIAHRITDLDPRKPGGISFFTSGFENRNEGHDQSVNSAGGEKKVTYFAEDVRVDKVFTDLARMFQIEFHVTSVGVVVTPVGGRPFPNLKAETGDLYYTYKGNSGEQDGRGDGAKPPN